MNSQAYLFLLRWSGDLPKGPAVLLQAPKMLSNIVRGDSLDVPYVNFIRVQSVSHGINKVGKTDEIEYGKAGWKDHDFDYFSSKATSNLGKNAGGAAEWIGEALANTLIGSKRSGLNDLQKSPDSLYGQKLPAGFKGKQPEQGTFQFQKNIDAATASLAYAASAVETFKCALFFYQRRVGFNVSGVVFPYFVVGLKNVVIRNWALKDDSETIDLSYEFICWGAYNQWADSPVPQALYTRYWDVKNGSGGMILDPFAAFVGVFTTALWGIGVAASAASSGGKGIQ